MKWLLSAAILLLTPALARATPSISSITGACNYGGTLTFNGTGFGSKPVQEKTYFFANFEDASAGVAGTTWCVTTTMGGQQNVSRVTTNCLEGVGCLGNTAGMDSNNNNTAYVSHTDVGASGKMFCSMDWRLDGTPPVDTENWKTFRWYNPNLNKNNFYSAQQVDGGFVGVVVEAFLDSFDASTMREYTDDIEPEPNVYEQIEYRVKQNSTGNATNGEIHIKQGPVAEMDKTDFQSNTTNDTAANGRYGIVYPVHMVWTSGAGGSNGFYANNAMRYDNILVETSWCAVFFTTASTLAAGGDRRWGCVQTWSSGGTQLTVVVPQKFTNGQQIYAYVRENGGTINTNGYALTFNSSSGAAAPTVTSVTPSVVVSTGGTSVTATCTGLDGMVVIKVGTTTATSTTYISATSCSFVVPSLPVGTYDVTATNGDAQAGTLTNGLQTQAPAAVNSNPAGQRLAIAGR